MNNTDSIIDGLQQIGNRTLTEEEAGEIELWQKGRALAHLTTFYGYEILLEMIQSYVQSAIKQSLTTKPGDNDRIVAAHAVAYTMNDFYTKLQQDIALAMDAARTTPEIVKSGLRVQQ